MKVNGDEHCQAPKRSKEQQKNSQNQGFLNFDATDPKCYMMIPLVGLPLKQK